MCFKWYLQVDRCFGQMFEKYGRFIARHPIKVIVITLVINAALGFGLFRLNKESGIEQYTPTDSTASQNRDQIKRLFVYNTSKNFYEQSLPDLGIFGSIIIERKDGRNILNSTFLSDLLDIYAFVNTTIAYDDSGAPIRYPDICAKRFSSCVVDGDLIFSSSFIANINAGTVSYPNYTHQGQTVFIDRIIGGTEILGGYIITAKALKLKFNLESEHVSLSSKWELAFIDKIASYSSSLFSVKYAHSDSLSVELSKSVQGDITFFSVTFTLMIMFSSLTLLGKHCVANRYNLAFAGVLGTGLAIVSSFGLTSLCGVNFVDIVGAMPFLIIGVGVDDMFILLSGLADTRLEDNVEIRIGKTMKTSGLAITITSLTDVIGFCAGAGSVFPTVRSFSWYTGCAILFCYLNNITFFAGCMTINEKRVLQNRHFCTCRVLKSKEKLMNDKVSKCVLFCCPGSPVKHREEIEGPMEKFPKRLIKILTLKRPSQLIIVFIFLAFLGVSSWGTSAFRENLDIRDLVGADSYYYKFYDSDQNMFSQRLMVSLNIQNGVNYRLNTTYNNINFLLTNVKNDKQVLDYFFISWIHSYGISTDFDDSSDLAFMTGLKSFLATASGNVFVNDVMIDTTLNSISASRLHVLTESVTSSSDQANLMTRIRKIVDSSSLPVFAYAPAFIFFEQYVQIIPQTMQTLGVCIGVVFLVTAFFIPLPLIILLVTITVVMIMIGVVGFIQFWGLTLSSVTMIHIVMCFGFCIDFSTHICIAFVHAEGTRYNRVSEAIDTAGGPIFNGAISTIIGVLMLAFSSSYIFFSFFKVMFLVMIFGLLYSMLLLPVILAFVGPEYNKRSVDGDIISQQCNNKTSDIPRHTERSTCSRTDEDDRVKNEPSPDYPETELPEGATSLSEPPPDYPSILEELHFATVNHELDMFPL